MEIRKRAKASKKEKCSYLVGVYAVRAAYDLNAGRLISAQTLAPTAPVTPENIDQWMEQCW